MAGLSLTNKAVEIEIKYREPQLVVARETAQRLLQAVDEQHPVGQPGQCVVQRTVDQLVFRFLALGDAADRAGHAPFLPAALVRITPRA